MLTGLTFGARHKDVIAKPIFRSVDGSLLTRRGYPEGKDYNFEVEYVQAPLVEGLNTNDQNKNAYRGQ